MKPEFRQYDMTTRTNSERKRTMICQLMYRKKRNMYYSKKQVENAFNDMKKMLFKDKRKNKQTYWLSLGIMTKHGYIPSKKIFINNDEFVSFDTLLFKSGSGVDEYILEQLFSSEDNIRWFNINMNRLPSDAGKDNDCLWNCLW